ncbi:TPA: hypothetical protein NJY08_004877 [Salmonella enterica subsp. enterica serovar Typhi str. AG3]|nr:hypothetical protein [Salmonella enterica subsp. enterica serovar Typhi str. AG3]
MQKEFFILADSYPDERIWKQLTKKDNTSFLCLCGNPLKKKKHSFFPSTFVCTCGQSYIGPKAKLEHLCK